MKKALLLLLVFFSLTAHADFYDGNRLYELGKTLDTDHENYSQTIFFTGYVSGVIDACNGMFLLIPPNVTVGQLSSIVEKYLRENPERRNLAGAVVVYHAIATAFPESVIKQKSDNKQPNKAK